MSTFRKVANVSVKGWCKRGGVIPLMVHGAKDTHTYVEMVISLTNDERFIAHDCADTRIEFRFVDAKAARGEGWNCATGGRVASFNRHKADIRSMSFDALGIWRLVKDQPEETQDLLWELLMDFNELVFGPTRK